MDRSRTVTFTFDGQSIEAYAGDTVASAVYAAGIRLFSRSFKYHRPRGLLCCAGRCPNCLVSVDGVPNVRACTTPVAAGLRVEPQNAFPSLQHDALAAIDVVDRLLPPGFYYKTFIYPRRAWPLYEWVLRHVAGLGTVDFASGAPAHAVRRHLHPDVVVVGGGVAGLSAALAAAAQGLRVVVVDENPHLGGHLRGETRVYDEALEFSGQTGHAIATTLAERVADHPAITVLTGAQAFGLYEGHLLGVSQGDTLIEVRARSIVVATGSAEHPLVFRNNDLPGVMLGSAATRLMRLWGVKPASRAVVISGYDEGLRVALDLLAAGVAVAAVAEHRGDLPDSAELRLLTSARVPVLTGWTISAAHGKGQVEGATLVQLDSAGRPVPGAERRIPCSLVAVSAGLETNVSLLGQAGCTLGYDEHLDLFTARSLAAGVYMAGDVTGVRDLCAALLGGRVAGRDAVAGLVGADSRTGPATPPDTLAADRQALSAREDAFRARAGARPVAVGSATEGKSFVCPCEDVTRKDIDWCVAEGFDTIEMLKRYSTVTMGPCQGKMCAMNAVAACARAAGRTIAETGTTTARPLTAPVPLGTLGGPHWEPTRLTPLHDRHVALGAQMMDAGQWKRPHHYTTPADEARAVRDRVGLIDVSTLGKLDLRGPDARHLLERVYTNTWADLRVGRSRYGVMVDDTGVIMDDGTVTRLDEDHYFITTTSSGVTAVEEWLTLWMEGTGWQARVTNVTAALAAVNLAGPRARDVLARVTDLDISAAHLPYLRAIEGIVAGVPARILRIGFVGELGYEMHVPAQYGIHLWDALMKAGQDVGITPFGVEAQRLLRLEKGHIIVTQDTDALSTPLEAGLAWAVKLDKPAFVGKRSLALLKETGIAQTLVGFETVDVSPVPDEGAPIVHDGKPDPVGRVTSARFSPTLDKTIGLAWVPVSLAEHGSALCIGHTGGRIAARVVPTPFYDPSGARMKS